MIITISRQASTNGALIGRMVAERLGMRFYDRELVEEIARRLHTDTDVISHFDEAALNPVASILMEWRSSINEMVYIRSLHTALRRIGEEDNAVILGRGANYVLRCLGCLHARMVAPLELRIAIYRAEHPRATVADAQRALREVDTQRAQFIWKHFRQDIDDPEGYDLVINLAAIGPEAAADIIVHAAEERFARHIPAEPKATLPQHLDIMLRRKKAQPRGPQHGRGEAA